MTTNVIGEKMSNRRLERYRDAYLAMAKEAKYRPQAPSDGCGSVLLTQEQIDDPRRLEAEATAYAIASIRKRGAIGS
jgi:hypothetical protein